MSIGTKFIDSKAHETPLDDDGEDTSCDSDTSNGMGPGHEGTRVFYGSLSRHADAADTGSSLVTNPGSEKGQASEEPSAKRRRSKLVLLARISKEQYDL